MDILLVTGRFPQRSETFIYRKAVALARRGHRVRVASREPGEWHLYPDPVPPTLEVFTLAPDHSLADPRRALRVLAHGVRSLARSPSRLRELHDLCHRDPRTRGDGRRH